MGIATSLATRSVTTASLDIYSRVLVDGNAFQTIDGAAKLLSVSVSKLSIFAKMKNCSK